jgi:excisionase family DNA binding protein
MPQSPEPADRLMTDDEAAAYLSASTSTLNFWRTQRRGPAFVKLGRNVRYRRCDLDRWIEANRRETSDSRAAAGAAS